MLKKVLIGLASLLVLAFIAFYITSKPQVEADGSYMPSKLALALATVDVSDFENVKYEKYQGENNKILAIFTEEKNMKMQNGKLFRCCT